MYVLFRGGDVTVSCVVRSEFLIAQLESTDLEHADEDSQLGWAQRLSVMQGADKDNLIAPSSIESTGRERVNSVSHDKRLF